jgi:hypothetical protein
MIWADPSKTINSSPPLAIALIARHDDAVNYDTSICKNLGLYLLDPAHEGGQRGEAFFHRYTITPDFEVPNGTLARGASLQRNYEPPAYMNSSVLHK